MYVQTTLVHTRSSTYSTPLPVLEASSPASVGALILGESVRKEYFSLAANAAAAGEKVTAAERMSRRDTGPEKPRVEIERASIPSVGVVCASSERFAAVVP